jgi:hypothetical protein
MARCRRMRERGYGGEGDRLRERGESILIMQIFSLGENFTSPASALPGFLIST